MTLDVILVVIKAICVIAITVAVVRALENFSKSITGDDDLREEVNNLEREVCYLRKQYEDLDACVDKLIDECIDFYDNQFTPLAEMHEVTSKDE